MRYPFGISPKLFWLIIGIIVVQGYYFTRKEYMESKNWPMTKGRIIQSELIDQSTPRLGTGYEPRITYEYQVNGIRYTSNAIFIGVIPRVSLAEAKSIINRYQFGKEVAVFYNPNYPREAFLERRVSYPLVGILPEQK